MDSLRVDIFTAREKRAAAALLGALLLLAGSGAWWLRGSLHPAPVTKSMPGMQPFAAFTFVSGTEAYALAGSSEHPNSQVESVARVGAYRTTDGARSWRRLAMPAGAPGIPLSLSEVPSGSLLLSTGDPVGAFPSSFWLSTNRGESWRRIPTPAMAHVARLDMLSPRTGYLVGQPESALTAQAVYWTQDGGASWTPTLGLGAAIAGPYLGPVFDSPTDGWLMTGSFVPRPGGARPALLRTRDSGATWQEIPIPAPPDKSFTLDLPVFPDGGLHGFLALGGAAGMLVYETRDGGETWAPPYQTAVPWFEADTERWVYSQGRFLETSFDWGRSWTTAVVRLPALGLALGHVVPTGPVLWSFPNGDGPGYSTGSETVLLRSTNGGASWSRMRWPGS